LSGIKYFRLYFSAVFIGLIVFFTLFRNQIGDYSAALLVATHEITVSEKKPGKPRQKIKITTNPKLASIKKTKVVSNSSKIAFSKPVTVKIPKTPAAVIAYSNDLPDWDDSKFPVVPSLRKFDGKKWQNEKTEFKFSTDGRNLYIIGRLYDKNPKAAITKHTKDRSGKNAWQDDSIEIFLMKNSKSRYFVQYILSVSGVGCTFLQKKANQPNKSSTIKKPKNFKLPRFDAYSFDGGFELELTISLSNIGIRKLNKHNTFLLQLVRNYRGQNQAKSITLQLFPVYIYADSRFGINNHDRRAFQSVKLTEIK
jgi:Carbohydrate family 9 binding domain-like